MVNKNPLGVSNLEIGVEAAHTLLSSKGQPVWRAIPAGAGGTE